LVCHVEEWEMVLQLKSIKEKIHRHVTYKEYKNSKWLIEQFVAICTLNWWDISLHCSSEGSTPVGLWAHAWSKKKEPSGAFWQLIEKHSSELVIDKLSTRHKSPTKIWKVFGAQISAKLIKCVPILNE
jgi:hypothetical protein